jgi:Family of unknown function (DUF6314)
VAADAPAAVYDTAAGEPVGGPALPGGTVGYLAGDWDVVREIADHRSGQAGEFRGRASFQYAPDSGGGRVLDFTERGELRFGGHRGPASRSLRYHGRADGGADVRFVDGRAFFGLDLRFGSCRAVHPCRADRYAVTVTWLSPDCFTEIWRVTGPDKDYDMTTVYTRTGCEW